MLKNWNKKFNVYFGSLLPWLLTPDQKKCEEKMAYSASSIFYCPNPNLISPKNGVVSSSNKLLGTKNSFFLGSKLVSKTTRITTRPEPVTLSGSYPISAESRSFDVVIVGAGIIGLTIARQFLIGSDLSVAVVDKAVPCSGATGAGIIFCPSDPSNAPFV